MTRESVSRPTWSVPKNACASGGLFIRRKFVLSGSAGAIHGAAIAIATMSAPTRPPAAERGLRQTKRANSPAMDRWPGSGITDARVEPGVAQIDQEVHQHEDDRVEQDEVLDHDDVALDERNDEGATQARDSEGLLDCNRAPEHEAEEYTGDRDDRQERVGQGVAQDDTPLQHSLGAGRAHVVLVDDLEEARARHPRDVGALGQAQHDRGPDDDLEVLPGRIPGLDDDDGRLVPEPEEQREHDEHPEPKAGNG